MYFKKRGSYIDLKLKNISRVVCFAPSLLIFWRRPRYRRTACTKSSAPSVQTTGLFSSSIRHASIISLRDGGTTLGSLESERENLTLFDWMTVYAYVDTLPQPINQGEVVKYFATRPEGALLFTQSTLSRKLQHRSNMEACMDSNPNALSCK